MKSEEEILRNFIVGTHDPTIRYYECHKCKAIHNSFESDRICICGGGFICPTCGANNMISNIEWVLDEQKGAE